MLVLLFFIFNIFICNNNISLTKRNLNIQNPIINKIFNYQSLSSTKRVNAKKNVILGVIQNYSVDIVLPFFNSLFSSNIQNCDIVIFVRNVSITLINYLKKIGVSSYAIPPKYNNFSIINLRWKMYKDFLIKKKNDYNLVLSVDVRDTFFQKDLFKYYENHKGFLGISIEDGTLQEELNKKWIIDLAGEENYKTIQNERIICIGTLWGTIDKFLEFSNLFWKNLVDNPLSIEQGICNYLFYYKKIFNDCLVKSDNFGPVMTIGLTNVSNLNFDLNNNLLNFKGEIAAVVHQYDRKLDIVNKINYKYIYSNNLSASIINHSNIINMSLNNRKFNNSLKANKSKTFLENTKNKEYYVNIISFLLILQFFTIILLLKSLILYFHRRNY